MGGRLARRDFIPALRTEGPVRDRQGMTSRRACEVTCCTREDLNSAAEEREEWKSRCIFLLPSSAARGAERSAQAGRGGAGTMVGWEARVTGDTTLTWDTQRVRVVKAKASRGGRDTRCPGAGP